MSDARLQAESTFSEWTGLLRKQSAVTQDHIDELRPFIDGLYEGPFPGTAHAFLQLRRDRLILVDMLEVVSLLVPHEAIVRALATSGR